jgi:ribosome-binding protein aMBF1 (putative translation factor)
MIPVSEIKDDDLMNPEVKAEYDRLGPVYAVVGTLVAARRQAGLTQKDVALRMNTKQSVVARMERTVRLPSLDLALRYAKAVGLTSLPIE